MKKIQLILLYFPCVPRCIKMKWFIECNIYQSIAKKYFDLIKPHRDYTMYQWLINGPKSFKEGGGGREDRERETVTKNPPEMDKITLRC